MTVTKYNQATCYTAIAYVAFKKRTFYDTCHAQNSLRNNHAKL